MIIIIINLTSRKCPIIIASLRAFRAENLYKVRGQYFANVRAEKVARSKASSA